MCDVLDTLSAAAMGGSSDFWIFLDCDSNDPRHDLPRLVHGDKWTPSRSNPRRPIIDLPRAKAVRKAERLSTERNSQPAIRTIRRHPSVLRRRAGGGPYRLRLPEHDRSLWAWCERNRIAHRHNSHQREIQNRGRCGTFVFGRVAMKQTATPF